MRNNSQMGATQRGVLQPCPKASHGDSAPGAFVPAGTVPFLTLSLHGPSAMSVIPHPADLLPVLPASPVAGSLLGLMGPAPSYGEDELRGMASAPLSAVCEVLSRNNTLGRNQDLQSCKVPSPTPSDPRPRPCHPHWLGKG